MKTIGMIGLKGRMGQSILNLLEKQQDYQLGPSFAGSTDPLSKLTEVFNQNDCIVDFSSAHLLPALLAAALKNPKPLLIGTTGWQITDYQESLQALAQSVPVIIAPNTSLGACLQSYLAEQLAKVLPDDYDIDIAEKHHRDKQDSPSGTSLNLAAAVQASKHHAQQQRYAIDYHADKRLPQRIALHAQRAGAIPGEHEISFTSKQELISIKHIAFDRELFAQGVMKSIDYLLKQNTPGIYRMRDVWGLA